MRATSEVRVGVVGTGAMGTSHVRTLSAWVPGARVAAVYDADRARAEGVAAEAGAAVAASAAALISDRDVDAVLIAAPDLLHEELALACLAAGRPTLCEKPLAITPEGSQRIVDAEVAGGRRLVQVGFMRRFDPAFVALKEHVDRGGVGEPRVVHCIHRNARSHPSATSDGIVLNSMVHELDHLPWLLGSPLSAITVLSPQVPGDALRDPQVALIETVSGVLATVEVFVNARYGYDVRCEVVGDSGTARLTAPYGLAVRSEGGDGRQVSDDFVERFADAYRIELASWIASVEDGAATGPSAWDGHRANLAAAAGVTSLRTGRRVEVPAPPMPSLYA